MVQANFSFISDASGGDQFTVVSFSANEALSSLYQYEIEIKSPLSAEIDLDDVLDNLFGVHRFFGFQPWAKPGPGFMVWGIIFFSVFLDFCGSKTAVDFPNA